MMALVETPAGRGHYSVCYSSRTASNICVGGCRKTLLFLDPGRDSEMEFLEVSRGSGYKETVVCEPEEGRAR